MKPIQLRCPKCNRFLGTSRAAHVDVKLKCGNCGTYQRQKLARLTLAGNRGKLTAYLKPQEGSHPQTLRGTN